MWRFSPFRLEPKKAGGRVLFVEGQVPGRNIAVFSPLVKSPNCIIPTITLLKILFPNHFRPGLLRSFELLLCDSICIMLVLFNCIVIFLCINF